MRRFAADSQEAVDRLAAGDPAPVKYNDRYHPANRARSVGSVKRSRRTG